MLGTKPTGPDRFPRVAQARVMAAHSAATRKRLRTDRLEAEAARLRTEAVAVTAAAVELTVDRDALR